MEDHKTDRWSDFWLPVAKTAAILLLVGVFLDYVLPDSADVRTEVAAFKRQITKNFKDDRAKLYALSFIQNPAALYKTSEIAEREGKIDSAIRDIEMAIGLLEMHSADKLVIKRYYERYERLAKLKLEAKPVK